jgi:hypothetical protein
MKPAVKYLIILLIGCTLLLLSESPVKAGVPSFNDNDPEGTPIDGGISLLVAAGVGYGVKKLSARKKAVGNIVNEDEANNK